MRRLKIAYPAPDSRIDLRRVQTATLPPWETPAGVELPEGEGGAEPAAEGEPAADYLSRQLIAYIGNKRRLLGFLKEAFLELSARRPVRRFLDPFAGSGAVARLAKSLGYAVEANDWEMYSWIVTSGHVAVDRSELDVLFASRGGVACVLEELSLYGALGPDPDRPYISRHYAPERTNEADYRRERLFYTHENALFVDRVRERIEEEYSGWELETPRLKEKILLLSALIYEAATHANTSGVFKACHKGFGGFGRDALGRILAPMRLEPPLLIDGRRRCAVARMDAAAFAAGRSVDLCYLDPPYNTHQYGSNYHLLNTIALWDKPPVSQERRADGRLAEKAAIRKDWVNTRSDFCYADRVRSAFERLLDAVDSRYIALSYNTEGLLPFEELYDMLARHGRVEILGTDYVKYPGGRQSLRRRTHNLEFLVVVTSGERLRASDRDAYARNLLERRARALLRCSFHPDRVRGEFETEGETLVGPAGRLRLPMAHLCFFAGEAAAVDLSGVATWELAELETRLARCQCVDRLEEATVLLDLLASRASADPYGTESPALQRRLARVVRKFAHRRYRSELEQACRAIDSLIESAPRRFARLARELVEIRKIAALRFQG